MMKFGRIHAAECLGVAKVSILRDHYWNNSLFLFKLFHQQDVAEL